MFLEVLQHEYFWLSFFPVSFLGVGFWFLFIERNRQKKDSLWIFVMALFSGVFSAIIFSFFQEFFLEKSLFIKVLGEEAVKCIIALGVMQFFKKKIETIAGGIVYGFAIGIGFALAENIVYLVMQYNATEFLPEFWIQLQGRFWSSTLLHGITSAFFGLFYAGAYLSKDLHKGGNISPFTFPSQFGKFQILQLKYIFTFHVSRKHLIFGDNALTSHPEDEKHMVNIENKRYHSSPAVILEGFFVALLVHFSFNFALEYLHVAIAFFISISGMFFLKQKIKNIPQVDNEQNCSLFLKKNQ